METRELQKYKGREGKGTFRAMTFDEARALQYGQHIWVVSNERSNAIRVKVNGAPRTWKRDTSRIEIPVKYGLYEYHTFTDSDISNINQCRLLVEVDATGKDLGCY